MERTPKAKARRQSLPTQHHLSHPTVQDDGSTSTAAHAELVRFRDEMGIHGHPHSIPVVTNANHTATFDAGTSRTSAVVTNNNKRYSPSNSSAADAATNRAEQRSVKVEASDVGTSLTSANRDANANSSGGESGVIKKKVRKKWSIEETKMLVEGCRKHGVGNWKSMLDDQELLFDPDRTPVDLKDRFRTYFPDTYRRLYPNAKTHIPSSSARAKRTELPDCPTYFEKSRSKKRRPFTKEEDDALREGFQKHGTVWAIIAKNPILSTRRSTDLRDRFRNAFPDLYEKAGYKPRPTKPGKKQRGADIVESTRQTSGSAERRNSSSFQARELTTVREMSMEPEQVFSTTPEADDSFEMNGTTGNESASELPHTPQMETDMDIGLDEKHSKAEFQSTSTATTYANSDAARPTNVDERYASRQRSSSNAQRSISGEVDSSPHQGYPQNVQPSPAFPQGVQDHKISNASWYPARWLSGAQGGYMDDPNASGGRGQASHPQARMDSFDGVSGLGLNGVGFSPNSGLGLGFGLVTGGWENQQTIIDRYDLPSSAAHLLHGGEFQSEAGIGDTGSSISGLEEYNANSQMGLSSHHRYAGDLFLARGAGFGGGGWNGWGHHGYSFMFGGSNQGNMPSFARAGMDLGGPLPDPTSHLSSGAQSPEFPQMLRSDQSIEDLGAALGGSILSSPHSVDPSKTLLHDIATPPPGTPAPTSPETRSFSNVDMYGNPNHVHGGPGVGLVRHSSMGTDLVLQGHTTQLPSRHPFQQQASSTSSHSRSYSQPPSEHRIQPGQIRSATTAVSSPVKVPFQNLDARGYEVSFEGVVHSRNGSPARGPNSFGQDATGGPSTVNGQYQSHQMRHSHQYAQDSDSQQQEQQQQRTPVQSHATLRTFETLFPPASSASLFTPPNAPWAQLSSVAMALDLHGASHPYGTGHPPPSGSHSSFGVPVNGAYGNHFMEQYLDFDTNALDLATPVTATHTNLVSPHSSNHSVSSPPSQYPITPSTTVSNHLQSPVSVYSQKHSPNSTGSKPVFKTPNLPASRAVNPNTYLQQQQQQQQQQQHQFTSSPPSLLPGSMSMDDSMIVTQPHQSHLPHGGMMRRESFSYGTTAANQSTNSGMMLSLNRVQSAGSAGAGSTSLSVPQAHHHHHRSAAAQENFKQKGWDKTITTRRAKRASWGAAQSYGDA